MKLKKINFNWVKKGKKYIKCQCGAYIEENKECMNCLKHLKQPTRRNNMENKEKWLPLLKEKKAFCYIKTNRYIHDSGYRCFEVGYCTLKDNGERVDEKLILSKYSDHFWHRKDILTNKPSIEFSMDVLLDGNIRLFDREILTWENNYEYLASSFSLEHLKE